MKSALFVASFISIFMPIHATAEAGKTRVAEEKIRIVGPRNVEPGPSVFSGDFAHWTLDENWFVRGRHTCSEETLWGWWPSEPKCAGQLLVQQTFRIDRFTLPAGRPSLKLSVNGMNGNATELYDLLVRQGTPIVSVNDYQFELRDFQKLSEDNFIQARKEAWSEVADKRLTLIFSITAVLAALAAAGFALRWAYKKIPTFVNAVKAEVGDVQEIRVRRIARDEVIRQTAREVLADACDQEKAALRSQIQQAMDSGNQDLAATSSSVLKKVEKA